MGHVILNEGSVFPHFFTLLQLQQMFLMLGNNEAKSLPLHECSGVLHFTQSEVLRFVQVKWSAQCNLSNSIALLGAKGLKCSHVIRVPWIWYIYERVNGDYFL